MPKRSMTPAVEAPWSIVRKGPPAGGNASRHGRGKTNKLVSLQERTLKVDLEIGAGTIAVRKEAPEMFRCLEQRVSL